MENNNNNKFLGKLEKSGCYVNNGKYGYFLTCGKNNFKKPEWLNPDEVTLDMAKRLIAFKKKRSEQWLEKKTNESKNDESDDETSEDPIVKRLTKNIKINLKS